MSHALADFDKALDLAPQNSDIYEARAIVFNAQKDYDRAIEDDSKALEINPYSGRRR